MNVLLYILFASLHLDGKYYTMIYATLSLNSAQIVESIQVIDNYFCLNFHLPLILQLYPIFNIKGNSQMGTCLVETFKYFHF